MEGGENVSKCFTFIKMGTRINMFKPKAVKKRGLKEGKSTFLHLFQVADPGIVDSEGEGTVI